MSAPAPRAGPEAALGAAAVPTPLAELAGPWDLVVVGGGITGAGVLREAARRGLRALLLEANDFASGSSSRSSKMVHGGLRYLRQGRFDLTFEAVRERERLLREAPGLVEPQRFALLGLAGDRTPPWLWRVAVTLYAWMAGRWPEPRVPAAGMLAEAPALLGAAVTGAFGFDDATTDDARLVLRVLRAARAAGGVARSYTRVTTLLRDARGRVVGVAAAADTGDVEIRARVVVDATGAWGDRLSGTRRLRPIRGSHLVLPADRVPVPYAVALEHPRLRRAVFLRPWAGVTIVGTTDVAHEASLDDEPVAARDEIDGLLEAVTIACPGLGVTARDLVAVWAGVRPIVGTGAAELSKEPRDDALWASDGLVAVAGGKLTTFAAMARRAVDAAARVAAPRAGARLDGGGERRPALAIDAPAPPGGGTPDLPDLRRLVAGYGPAILDVLAAAPTAARFAGTDVLEAEVAWAARHEDVRHLDDLLLRRVRLGLVLADGARAVLPDVRRVAQPALGWDDARWAGEEAAWLARWTLAHRPPT